MGGGGVIDSKSEIIDSNSEKVNVLSDNMSELQAQNSEKGHIKTVTKARSYTKVMLKGKNNEVFQIRALLDTGNSIQEGAAISEEFHKQLKVGFANRKVMKIGTAKSGSSLQKMGTSNPIQMRIHGINKVFKVKPTVIRDLSDKLNLGDKFLENIAYVSGEVKITYNKSGKTLNLGSEKSEMIQTMTNPDEPGRGRLKEKVPASRRSTTVQNRQPGITVAKEATIRGNTIQILKVKTQRPVKGPVLVENGCSTLVEVPASLYSWDGECGQIAVLNMGDETVKIPEGKKIAHYCVMKARDAEEKVSQVTETEVSEEDVAKMQETAIKELEIDSNPMLKKNPKAMAKVKALIKKYYKVFGEPSLGRTIGRTDLMEFEIELTPDARPVKQRCRPLNPDQQKSLRKQLDEWIENDVIEPSKSPWSSPLVPAWKKGGKIRWAVDYRALNAVTVGDSFPVPNIETNLERLAGSRVYSALDAASAYNIIPVAKKARPLTAFVSCFGLWQYKRMPFGCKNAGNCYSRFVEMLLSRLKSGQVIGYLDDILIHTPGIDEHIDALEEVLKIHEEAGIKLRGAKTKLFQPDAEYLGFKVSEEGISMNPEYLERILQWPEPVDVKSLQTALGYFGYYRSHIPGYAELTHEMNGQRKNKQLEWTPSMSRDFQKLKDAFRENKVRSYPRYDIPEKFQLTTDYSKKAVSAVLSQVQNGEEKFIGACARKCTKYEANYASVKGELSAIIMGLRKFEHILRYRPFIINTDSAALKYLKTIKNPANIWFRWLTEISSYDFEIKHRPGRENLNADALSRADHHPPASEEEEHEHKEDFMRKLGEFARDLRDEKIVTVEQYSPQIREAHRIGAELSREELIKAQKEDPVLQEVRKWVENQTKPDKKELKGKDEDLKIYRQVYEALEIEEDLLYYKMELNTIGGQEVKRMVVPSSYAQIVFKWAHEHVTAGHFGANATVHRSKRRFFFPGMPTTLRRMVGACKPCLAKIQKVNLKKGVHVPRRSGYPLECVYLDLVGPLPVTINQYKYILTCEDGFTKFSQAYPLHNKEASTVARVFLEEFICRYGIPSSIHSDNGKEFCNNIITELMDRLNIQKTTTPTYNPQSNLVERFHRTLSSTLRVFMDREDTEWPKYLPPFLMAYNSKVNESTQMTPHFAFFLREMRLPIDLVLPAPGKKEINEHVDSMLNRMKTVYNYIRKNQETTIRRNAAGYQNIKSTFKEGDVVFYLSPRKMATKPHKLVDSWLGPYVIVNRISEVLYKIKPRDYEGPTIAVHCARLIDASKRQYGSKVTVPTNTNMDDDGDPYMEEIRLPRDPDAEINLGIPIHVGFPETDITDVRSNTTQQIDPPSDDIMQQEHETDVDPDLPMPTQQNEDKETAPDPVEENVPVPENVQTEPRDNIRLSSGDEAMPMLPPPPPRSTGAKRKKPSTRFQRSTVSLDEMLYNSSDSEMPRKHLRPRPNLGRKFRDLLTSDEESLQVIKIKVDKNSTKPTKGTQGSAAHDLYSDEKLTIKPGETKAVPVRLRIAIPEGYCLLILSRSGLAKKGITVAGGLIDSDYRGPIFTLLYNSSKEDHRIESGQRIAQGLILRAEDAEFEDVDELDDPGSRGDSGFGSTGM